MSKKLLGLAKYLIPAAAGGGAGLFLGGKLKERKTKEKLQRAAQSVELSERLRDMASGKARRTEIENYYLRKALNQLARSRVKQMKGSK